MTTGQREQDLRRVLVTGIGLVTPLGASPWSTIRALDAGRTTADRLAELPDDLDPTTLASATAGVALVAHARVDPALDLAERAGRQALSDAGIAPHSAEAARTDCVLASSKGAVMALVAPRQDQDRSACLIEGPHGFLASRLRHRLGLGSVSAPVAACATSLVAMDRAAHAIADGRSRRTLVVAVEASLHPLFVRSYLRLGALAPTIPTAAHRALPLDRRRVGFTLCQCASALVLEHESPQDETKDPIMMGAGAPACSPRALRPWARLIRTATGAEPHDLVRAAVRFGAVERAVRRVIDGLDHIALVQPHAPGTPDHDARELAALAAALGDRAHAAPLYASKGAIGHGLGAAGLVNVALSCLIGRIGRTPPMPWLTDPIESAFALGAEGCTIDAGAHVCVAAGFGGHVAAVSLEPMRPAALTRRPDRSRAIQPAPG